MPVVPESTDRVTEDTEDKVAHMPNTHDTAHVPAGLLEMGSEHFYADERPVRTVEVESFAIDRHPVTNAMFDRFVRATGHVTVAERTVDGAEYAGLTASERQPGSVVFRATPGPADLTDWRQWWHWVPGADWRHPHGPGSTVDGLDDHPVVQVAFADAAAYAEWVGAGLPREEQFEWAARGGLSGTDYAWGQEAKPDGRLMANTWQGAFPYRNDGALGWRGTSPVGQFPANDYGLLDMIGNVWEWTTTPYASGTLPGVCCGGDPDAAAGSRVLKGGSHLCAPEYCLRYRPAARSPQSEDSATTHIGFRCVW
jgi:formylglycine-generating enzyme